MSGNTPYREHSPFSPTHGDSSYRRTSPRRRSLSRNPTPPPSSQIPNRSGRRENQHLPPDRERYGQPPKRFNPSQWPHSHNQQSENLNWQEEENMHVKRHRATTPTPMPPSANDDKDYRSMVTAIVPYIPEEPRLLPKSENLEDLLSVLNFKKASYEEFIKSQETFYHQEIQTLTKLSDEVLRLYQEKRELELYSAHLKSSNVKQEEKLKNLETEVVSLKKGRQEMSILLQNKQTEVVAREKKIKDLEKELGSISNQNSLLEKQLSATEKQTKEWKVKIDIHSQEAQSWQVKYETQLNEYEKLREQEEKARNEIKRLKTLSFRQTGQIEKMIVEVTKKKDEYKTIESSFTTQKIQVATLTQKLDEVSRQNSIMSAHLEEKRVENEICSCEIERLKNKVNELEVENRQRHDVIDDLEAGFLKRQNEIMVASKSTIQWLQSRRSGRTGSAFTSSSGGVTEINQGPATNSSIGNAREAMSEKIDFGLGGNGNTNLPSITQTNIGSQVSGRNQEMVPMPTFGNTTVKEPNSTATVKDVL